MIYRKVVGIHPDPAPVVMPGRSAGNRKTLAGKPLDLDGGVVGGDGIEPPTSAMSTQRSDQLS
jgi:hypothetical protein